MNARRKIGDIVQVRSVAGERISSAWRTNGVWTVAQIRGFRGNLVWAVRAQPPGIDLREPFYAGLFLPLNVRTLPPDVRRRIEKQRDLRFPTEEYTGTIDDAEGVWQPDGLGGQTTPKAPR